jgi:phage/plasmid-like protein (TIGR03299 family)
MKSINNYFHRVGKDITSATSISEAIKLADLSFDVALEPVRDIRGNVIADTFNVARADTGESLGVNGSRYTPVQTAKAFDYMDELKQKTALTFHRGGMLKGGRFFISAEFDVLNLGGDMVRAFGVFLSSFDGSWANRMATVFNRNVCSNICGYTLRDKSDNVGLAAKHTANCETKLDTLVSVIAQRQARQVAMFTRWQAEKFSSVDMQDFAAKLFPNETKQASNARETLVNLFTDSRLGQFGQTKWDAFNSVSAFETHESTRRNSSRASADENAFDALVSHRSLANRAAELLVA